MAFPDDLLPLRAEMEISGTWTDITARVRGNNDTVTITRGAQNEQGDSLTPNNCTFKLNNADFYFSNRNPSSPNYGHLPQNTQVRFLLEDPEGMAFAPVNGYPYSYAFGDISVENASTADKAVLDITGDLDVRVDFDPDPYPGGGLTGYVLIGKYKQTSDQRSWALMLRYDGTLRLYWSTAGTAATLLSATSTAAVDFAGGRKYVRATLDVNNGAGGKTVTFYTASLASIQVPSGTFESGSATGWTAFDATVTASQAHAHSGSWSALLTVVGSPSQAYFRPTTGSTVTAGGLYRTTMWLYSAADTTVNVVVDWYDAGLGYIDSSFDTVTVPGGIWTKATVDAIAPALSAFAGHGPTLHSSPATGTQLWVDDIDFQEVTWNTLGSAVTSAGTTSVFSSSADLRVGALVNDDGGIVGFTDTVLPFRGRVYRAQVYSGIGGTLVADADFGLQASGDTSWSDGLGTPNTWAVNTVYGGVTRGRYRFWGEVAELPQKADSTGTDLYVPTVATDIVRRLTQGQAPVWSPLFRYLARFTTITQYHPLESGVSTNGTTGRAGSAIGSYDARYNDLTFGPDDGLRGSLGVATFNSDRSYLTANTASSANSTYQAAIFAFQMAATPGSETFFCELSSTGTVRKWHIRVTATTFLLRGYGADGSEIGNLASTFGTDVAPTDWILMRLQTHHSGGNIIAALAWCKVADTAVWGFTSTTEFPGSTSGRFTGYSFGSATQAITALDGLKLTHVMICQEEIPTADYDFHSAAGAYDGEPAGKRAIRTAEATGVPLIISGDPENTVPMGPEAPATAVANLEECAKVDGGHLTTRRDAPAFYLVTRASLLDQTATTLDHDDHLFMGTLDPVDNDATLRNEVTVTSVAGQVGTSRVTDGPRGIATVGRYDSAYPLNGYEEYINYLAQHATYLGTWDEVRLPQFAMSLAKRIIADDAALTTALHKLDIGSAVDMVNLPSWFPPGRDLEVMVRGYREVLSNKVHSLSFSAQNYGSFRAVNNLSAQSDVPRRAAATPGNHTIDTSINTAAMSLSLATAAGSALWTTAAGDFPLNIEINGEVMTLSGISGASSPQTGTVSARQVNGVLRSHSAGSDVQVVDRFYVAL